LALARSADSETEASFLTHFPLTPATSTLKSSTIVLLAVVPGSYFEKFVVLTEKSFILSIVDTVAIAFPAYTGRLNLAPFSTISTTSVIACTSKRPPTLGTTSFPKPLDAATTLS